MTPDEHIVKMAKAIRQAVMAMGDRFGSTEQDVAQAILELKASMQASSEPNSAVDTLSQSGSRSPRNTGNTVGP